MNTLIYILASFGVAAISVLVFGISFFATQRLLEKHEKKQAERDLLKLIKEKLEEDS